MTLLQQFERLDLVWGDLPNVVSSDYQIGPFLVRISGSDPLLDKLTRAFRHLKRNELSPACDLEIGLWDASIENQKPPLLDWEMLRRRVGRAGCYEPPVYVHWSGDVSALSVLNLDLKRAYYVIRSSKDLPWWTEGTPLQEILYAYLQEKGYQLTHTAAIGDEKGAILLSGKGGSGKSTTTLACLREGLSYLGEDHCILAKARVFSVYSSAKWTPYTCELFPEYKRWVAPFGKVGREKALVFYPEIFPSQIKSSLPIRAAIALSVGTAQLPIIQSSDASHTLQSLMISTAQQLPFRCSRAMGIVKDIVTPISHYRLQLGRDIRANVQLIRELING